ncbi:hypothetical protein [Sphingomonas sp. KR3-1]|uniref:hypothetical protein n=1 Tax=Sphingomonas sp. KR3-1 TaxID=3156611 RepID=UPI0032B5606D
MKREQQRRVRWNKVRRAAFLDHLAGTCNVTEAAALAGMSSPHVYHLRRTDERFAEEWHKALLVGYQMLETELLGHVLAGGGDTIERVDGRKVDVDKAMRLLALHRNSMNGKWKGAPATLKRARPEDTDAAILKKLAMMDRARARAAEEKGAQ